MEYEDSLVYELKHHPRVCSQCFALRHDEDPVPEHIARLAPRTHWASAVTPAWTRNEERADKDTPPGETVSDWHERTRCECGHFDKNATTRRDPNRPPDMGDVIDYAATLSETCDALQLEAAERGENRRAARFEHDPDVLFRCVRHLKSQPSYQHKDDYILAASLEVARKHA